MSTPVAPVQVTPKPGYLTTEFWVTLISNIVAIVTLVWPGHDFSQFIQIAAVGGAAVANALYAHGRSIVKATH